VTVTSLLRSNYDYDESSIFNVIGIGVTNEEISHMVNIIGCEAGCGAANPLEISWCSGGRLLLIKLVLGNLPTFYMSIYMMSLSFRKKLESLHNNFFIGGDLDDKKITWVKWKRCLASKKEGDLGIDCNGAGSRVWDDIWCWEQPLKWLLGASADFSVASVRSLVDSHTLETDNVATRWNRSIPIKVNVFLWRLKLNKIPSRVNLDRRGIEVGSIICSSCLDDIETVNHSFFNCGMAKDLWALLAKWWELDISVCGNIGEWYDWLDSLRASSKVCLFLEGVGDSHVAHMELSQPPKKAALWDSIVSQSFFMDFIYKS
nr:RNA-directed DNA polymerase, eukaryota, reverse transcriptase zinc-binding domain protein [Tanacetum cinerariifolium]